MSSRNASDVVGKDAFSVSIRLRDSSVCLPSANTALIYVLKACT